MLKVYINRRGYTPHDAVQDLRRHFGVGDIPTEDRVFVYPENREGSVRDTARMLVDGNRATTHVLTKSAKLVQALRDIADGGESETALVFHLRSSPGEVVVETYSDQFGAENLLAGLLNGRGRRRRPAGTARRR